MVPRFTKKRDQPYFAKRLFMIQMMNYFHQRKELLPQQFLHETFFLVVSNAALLGWYFSRSIATTIMTTCYASFTVLAYGQQVEFDRALKFDLPQSLYTRLVYKQKFGENKFDESNAKFIKRFNLAQ